MTIPKTKINADIKKDLSKLSIGVKTIIGERKGNNVNGPNENIGGVNIGGQGRGQGRGNGPGGGQRGRGNGSSRGGQGGDRSNPGGQARTTEVLLDFWFHFLPGT